MEHLTYRAINTYYMRMSCVLHIGSCRPFLGLTLFTYSRLSGKGVENLRVRRISRRHSYGRTASNIYQRGRTGMRPSVGLYHRGFRRLLTQRALNITLYLTLTKD